MSAYIQKISDGTISLSVSSQTIENPAHLATLKEFITSRGLSLADYKIADATEDEIQAMIQSAKTPMEVWQVKMRGTDGRMPRYLEDHITEDHDGVASNEFLQAKYDDKKTLRATKPE